MKAEIDPNVIYSVLEALKEPHIAILFGTLGVGLIFLAYAKVIKGK